MKSIYNVPQVRTQQTTALTNIGNLLDVTITGAQNNDILVYNAPKWVNKPQIINNNQDVNTVNPQNNEVLFHNGTEWINKEIALNDLSDVVIPVLPTINQVLSYDGDFWTPQTLASSNFATLNDVQITAVQNNDNIIYDSNTSKYINKKKYCEYDNYVNLSNQTVTGVERTVYFCNLATINLPASTPGSCIKIINTNGPLCTFAFTGIIYHIANNFNTSFSTVDAAEITLTGILGGNWQISSFTGRWVNNSTNVRLANNNLEDLRNMSIILPSAGQYLQFNGTSWVNNTISGFLTSFNGRTGPAISPVANDYSFTQINGISLTGPVNGQYLQYNGTNWINVNLPNQLQHFTSGGNLSNNNFQLNGGQSGNYNNAFYAASRTMSFKFMTVVLTANVGGGAASRIFTIYKNGIATTDIMTFVAASGTVQRIAVTSSFGLNDTYSILHTSVSGPANSAGAITIEYV